MTRFFAALSAIGLCTLLAAASSCRAPVDGRPEARCFAACQERASARCSEDQCARGCRFILDRLVEREDQTVLSCIASGRGACNDEAWAQCAVRVGVHRDGGPPVPEPLSEDEAPPPDDDTLDDGDAADDAGARADAASRVKDAGVRDAAIKDAAAKGAAAGKGAVPQPAPKAAPKVAPAPKGKGTP